MRLLLDTCVALWVFDGNVAIPTYTLDLITDPTHEVFVSTVSILEVVIKHQLGKLMLSSTPERLLPEMIEKHGLDVIGLSVEDVFKLSTLPLKHRDPFDRLLIAQATARRMTLVTPDKKIARYNVPCIWK